ncbi:hypothetical protein FRAHR75_1090006 [Frankia sp. Hr75.2]|nr:hypothetical protein FRAHR75_1090006 [Frankia sp. Hr75.2]
MAGQRSRLPSLVRVSASIWTPSGRAVAGAGEGDSAATTSGFATFGVLSFHAVTRGLRPAAAVPVLYAGAMGVDARDALATGWDYDRTGPRVLAVLPLARGHLDRAGCSHTDVVDRDLGAQGLVLCAVLLDRGVYELRHRGRHAWW